MNIGTTIHKLLDVEPGWHKHDRDTRTRNAIYKLHRWGLIEYYARTGQYRVIAEIGGGVCKRHNCRNGNW